MLIIPGLIFQSLTCDPTKIPRQDCISINSHIPVINYYLFLSQALQQALRWLWSQGPI